MARTDKSYIWETFTEEKCFLLKLHHFALTDITLQGRVADEVGRGNIVLTCVIITGYLF
jgi:hypothetical protein